MNLRNEAGFTWVEMVVGVVVILMLAAVLLPALLPHRGDASFQIFSQMQQLHLATQQMALDTATIGETNLGWPGDGDGKYASWITQLVKGNYLSAKDLCLLLSTPGHHVKELPTENNGGILVYGVKESSDANTVFLSTANFTNSPTGGMSDPDAMVYGKKRFIIFHKAGDGAILQLIQAGDTKLIGAYAPLCQ